MSRKLMVSSFLSVALMASVPYVAKAQESEAPAVTLTAENEGEMLYSADGRRVGAIYETFEDGGAGVIVQRKLIVIPAGTFAREDGKLKTTLTYRELMARR